MAASADGAGTTPRGAWIALAALLLVSLTVRLSGLGALLPHLPEPDNHVATQVRELEEGVPPEERSPVYRYYPLLVADIARLLPGAQAPAGADLSEHLRAASTVTRRVRLVSAFLSTLGIALAYVLARRFLAPWPALLAAALIAASLMHFLFSAQARAHGPHLALTLLAWLAALRLRARPAWDTYLLAGAAAGLAIAALHFGVFTLPVLVAAHLLRAGERRPADHLRLLAALALAVGLGGAFYSTEARPPGAEVRPLLAVSSDRVRTGAGTLYFEQLDGSGFAVLGRLFWEHDPVLLVGLVLGLVLLARRARSWWKPEVLVLLAYALPYVAVWGIYGRVWERYLLPLYPLFAVVAAWPAAWLARRRPAAGVAYAVLVLAFPAGVVVRSAVLRARDDTVEVAAAWIRANVAPEEGVLLVTPQLCLPLPYSAEALEAEHGRKLTQAWVHHQRELAAGALGPRVWDVRNVPLEATELAPGDAQVELERLLAELGPAYVVIESTNWNRRLPVSAALMRHAGERGTLVHDSDAGAAGRVLRTNGYQDTPSMLRRLLEVDRLGPRVQVYRMAGPR